MPLSLIDTTLILFPLGGAVSGAYRGFTHADTPEQFLFYGGLGSIAGVLAGLAAHLLLWAIPFGLLHVLEWSRPEFPPCRKGRCGAMEYELLRSSEASAANPAFVERAFHEGSGLAVRCQCGDWYFHDAKQRQFLAVSPDGTLTPYRYHRPLGRKWLPARDG